MSWMSGAAFGHDGSDCIGTDVAGVSEQVLRGEGSGASAIVGVRSCIVSTWLEGGGSLTGQSHGRLHPSSQFVVLAGHVAEIRGGRCVRNRGPR